MSSAFLQTLGYVLRLITKAEGATLEVPHHHNGTHEIWIQIRVTVDTENKQKTLHMRQQYV